MSKSFRKTPIVGISKAKSDKWYKKQLHKKERRKTRVEIGQERFDKLINEYFIYDDWSTNKDGKQYLSDQTPKGFTKSEWKKYKKKLLRK